MPNTLTPIPSTDVAANRTHSLNMVHSLIQDHRFNSELQVALALSTVTGHGKSVSNIELAAKSTETPKVVLGNICAVPLLLTISGLSRLLIVSSNPVSSTMKPIQEMTGLLLSEWTNFKMTNLEKQTRVLDSFWIKSLFTIPINSTTSLMLILLF
jgi:hypothetical protein